MDEELKELIEKSKGYVVVTVNNDIGGTTKINMKKGWKIQDALSVIRQLDRTSERIWESIEENMSEQPTVNSVN